ncbi:MAG: hemolysin III [Myxococcota bacterium]|jgi:hemolysin III
MTADTSVPSLRGVSHQYAAYLALPAGAALIALAPSGAPTVAAAIYAVTLCLLLSISALYHRRNWSDVARARMRRLDHSMIFVFIAGSFTPFPMLVLESELAAPVMATIWATALGGLLFKQLWIDAPSWLGAALYVVAGCVILPFGSALIDGIGPDATLLLGLGGVCYIVGAMIYAMQWPNPTPQTFGYHEIFHALVLVGVAFHYVAIARYAVGVTG